MNQWRQYSLTYYINMEYNISNSYVLTKFLWWSFAGYLIFLSKKNIYVIIKMYVMHYTKDVYYEIIIIYSQIFIIKDVSAKITNIKKIFFFWKSISSVS